MRFAEIALLALPFVVFVAWRLLAPSVGPPRILVIAVSATVVAMAGLLLGLWYEEAETPGTRYVPARLEDGRVLPSRVEPIAPRRVEPVAPGQAEPVLPGRVAPGSPGSVTPIAPGQVEPVAPGRLGLIAPGGMEPSPPGEALPVAPAQK